MREDANFDIWQLETFDELVLLKVDICKLLDEQLELIIEIMNTENSTFVGSMKMFKGSVLKSGLKHLIINGEDESLNFAKLERSLYQMRKSRQVPNWHIDLMKEKSTELKMKYFEYNPTTFIVNVMIPEPTFSLKLKKQVTSETVDLCSRDLEESKEDTRIIRKYPEVFSVMSIGDLRVLKGILDKKEDETVAIPADEANLLWNCREYLSRRFPNAIVKFIESIQWWIDPKEVDEAIKTIEQWRFPRDPEIRMEIAVKLMTKMTRISGLPDSPVWTALYEKLISSKGSFSKKYQSVLMVFLRSAEMRKLEGLMRFFKGILFEVDGGELSELYWRLKCDTRTDSQQLCLFDEFKGQLSRDAMQEIGKQEELFEAIERVLREAQSIKGPRTVKLEYIKKCLDDPESGIPRATQKNNPLIPGLQGSSGSHRVSAIVSDRSNLFKSTAFTVLLVFLRHEEPTSLPLIFKVGDDLRRDAACLRVFRAIWDIWWEEGGMALFPRDSLYGVTAVKEDFGVVEFVESAPLSKIVLNNSEGETESTGEWSIAKHLRELGDPEAGRNYLKSCVGFSLLTYLLGIGDRHLDNLLLTPRGNLLHIDFSFVFGADPKPFPPPIKITREMVRGFEMDGENEEKWNEFKGLCFTALSLLRRKSALILALISAEYPAESCGSFVRERLAVMVSQAEAIQKLDRLMEESRSAMFPQVMETIHKWVQYWKS